MKRKLTLSVEADTIQRMKQYARRRKVSISHLFAEWSEERAGQNSAAPGKSSLGKSMRGRWKPTTDRTVTDDTRLDYLLKKHAGR